MKHFKKFNDFISNNVIYHTVYENKDAFIIGNTLYYDNQKLVLNYTPIYESVTKRFVMLNENTMSVDATDDSSILSDIGSGIVNVASKVGNFAWDMVKLPSSDISTFEGKIEWAHWLTSSASLLSMVIGIAGSVFTFGASVLGGQMTAKTIDAIDIIVYIIEVEHYLSTTPPDFWKAAFPFVFGGISAAMLFTTPEGNSAIIKGMRNSLGKLKNKIRPSSLEDATYVILEQPVIKNKFKGGFIEMIKIIGEIIEKICPPIYKLGEALTKSTIWVVKKIGQFFKWIVSGCRNGWNKIKTFFGKKANNTIKVYLSDNKVMKTLFNVNEMDDIVKKYAKTDASRKKLIDVFEKVAKEKGGDLSHLKGVISADKLGNFIKNIDLLDPKYLDKLPNIINNKNTAKYINDFTKEELEILCNKTNKVYLEKSILNVIDKVAPDNPETMKKIIGYAKSSSIECIDDFYKIGNFGILDVFTKNNGDYFKTFASKEFKELGQESTKSVFDALTKNIKTGIKTNYTKVDTSKLNMDDFYKKIFSNGGTITFDGRVFKEIDDFTAYISKAEGVNGFGSMSKLAGRLNIFSWKMMMHSISNTTNDTYDTQNVEDNKIENFGKALCPVNNTDTIFVTEKSTDTEVSGYIKIKPVSERTPEQSALIKEYLKYIIEASQLLTSTIFDLATKEANLSNDKTSYDLSNEANYVNCAKLLQGYINNYLADDKKLSVDGAIGEKTLNAAYKLFNEFTTKDKDGKTIKTGTERANKTKELLEKLK